MNSEVFFERAKHQFDANLPFVIYRKPNEVTVKAIFQKDDYLHVLSNYDESGFLFAPFDSQQETIFLPLNQSEIFSYDYQAFKNDFEGKVNYKENTEAKNNHIQLVEKGIAAIKKQQFKKVVLSHYEKAVVSETNPLTIFKKMLHAYTNAFAYCWYHPKVGLWLGATPETLLQTEGNRFYTVSLAGTQLYKNTLEVSWQEKEKEEQQIVTDYIVTGLNEHVTDLNISKPETVKAGNLLHIKTTISGILKPSSMGKIIHSLHPTPAICGYPKEEAKKFILNNETYNREYYTGFLGELNFKETFNRNPNNRNVENNAYITFKTVTNLFVNLRCMQLKESNALIYVGGGITKDSVPEKEWLETINKTSTMKNSL